MQESPEKSTETRGPVNKEQALSVSEITLHIKEMLEGQFKSVWIKGELSNIRRPPSGHVYASLKDTEAQIRVVMFRAGSARPNQGELPFEWKEGAEVLVLGRLSVYPPQGAYQIIITHIEEVGSGALQAQFEALKKKLQAQGLFDAAHKKTLPFLPARVGVVTSPSGAAIRDILNVIARRFSQMPVDIYPAVVQGKEAAPALIQAIQLAEKLNRVDVLIVGRGGGSIEDLWCFNDEALVRAIYACPIPLVSAVGHEIDFTLCDFVADVRAPTPSAAAELVVPSAEELFGKQSELLRVLTHHILQIMAYAKQRLDTLFHQLEHPKDKLINQKQKLIHTLELLGHMIQRQLQQEKQKLERWLTALQSLDPKSVLSRGYALVSHRKTTQIISSAKGVGLREPLRVSFADGSLDVTVENIAENIP